MVTKKDLAQWYFKITDYADRLLADLDQINWREPIKIMQRHWIGRSEGAEVDFTIGDAVINSGSFSGMDSQTGGSQIGCKRLVHSVAVQPAEKPTPWMVSPAPPGIFCAFPIQTMQTAPLIRNKSNAGCR